MNEELGIPVAEKKEEEYVPTNTYYLQLKNFRREEIPVPLKHGDAVYFQGEGVVVSDRGEDNHDGGETRVFETKGLRTEVKIAGYNIPPIKIEQKEKSKSKAIHDAMYVYYHKLGKSDKEFKRIYERQKDLEKEFWLEKIRELEEGLDILEVDHYDGWDA